MSDAKVVEAAVDWYMARTAFLNLPSGHPGAREHLGRLADAENALSLAVRDGVNQAFSSPIPSQITEETKNGSD